MKRNTLAAGSVQYDIVMRGTAREIRENQGGDDNNIITTIIIIMTG
jgi:hypothetical protein